MQGVQGGQGMVGLLVVALGGAIPAVAAPLELASAEHAGGWLLNMACGEASFDTLEHHRGNPVYTGAAPDSWPVNGFLYRHPTTTTTTTTTTTPADPRRPGQSSSSASPMPAGNLAGADSDNQTVYVGLYDTGYRKPWSMLGLSSTDGGASFTPSSGPLVCDNAVLLFGIAHGCPDGSAVPDGDGGVHMVFDWTTGLGLDSVDNGLGYQHCATPVGNCTISKVPVNRMTDNTVEQPGYVTTYGGTLLRRANDWLVLSAYSTHGNAGSIWALAAMTSNGSSPDPAVARYTSPALLLYPESDLWHPHPCEFYPCFASAGYAYCPCTSLQLSRNIQVLYRAPLEQAHTAAAWEVYQAGSLYHWEGESTAPGMWGQTFSGFVDGAGGLQVMFPSMADGVGTINLARAPSFAALQSPRGFWVSAPQAEQIAVFAKTFAALSLAATVVVVAPGLGWTLRWNWRGTLGPDGAPFAGARMNPEALQHNAALCFDGKGSWSFVAINKSGVVPLVHGGGGGGGTAAPVRVELNQDASGRVAIRIDDVQRVVSGPWLAPADVGGSLAVHATVGASIYVSELVADAAADTPQRWLQLSASDGVTGGGSAAIGRWTPAANATLRSGAGFASPGGTSTLAKWSFVGVAVRLWMPTAPGLGTVTVAVDGRDSRRLDLHSAAPGNSSVIFEWHEADSAPHGRAGLAHAHALVVRWASGGGILLDSIDFLP